MTFDETMSALEQMGTEQNRKTYRRHGAGRVLFGVSFANLNRLMRRIKCDHTLAEQLWATGNTDAQTLALMIADPDQLTSSQADAWLKSITYSLLAEYLAALVVRTDFVLTKIRRWTDQKKEMNRACGYALVCSVMRDRPDVLTDEDCISLLRKIESEIHQSANRARHTMAMAICAIGISRSNLRDQAIATARRIGHVAVDHGDTSCTTPDPEAYIRKAANRQAGMRRRC